MDIGCKEYLLTEEEHEYFEENGFLIVRDVLPPSMVDKFVEIADRVDAKFRLGNYDQSKVRVVSSSDATAISQRLLANQPFSLRSCISKDALFLELLDWPRVFPKVWGILGWNIQLYHTRLINTPPLDQLPPKARRRLAWHQDSGRLNIELETDPRPRVSIKVGFFLTDTTEPDRGNMYVIPKSHLKNQLDFPSDGVSDPKGAMPLLIPAGGAVIFDRRLWHAPSPNYSDITRKAIMYGYSYRWLRPRDHMNVAQYMDECDPIRKQLLGASTDPMGYSSPIDADVPLRTWLVKNQLG